MSGRSSLHDHEDGEASSCHFPDMLSIFSLLPELLSDVFLMLSVHRRRDFARWFTDYSPEDIKLLISWITVSHVCQLWREVALNTAALWSTIVLDRRFPWATFLERAHLAPIYVFSYIPYAPEDWRVTLNTHITHTQTLYLSGYRPESMGGFNFPVQSSLLDELHLRLLPVRPQLDVDDFERECDVTHMHTDHGTEMYVGLIPRCAIASNMRSLKFIGNVLRAPSGPIRLPLQAVYDSLRAMPLLETLEIEHALGVPGLAASEIICLPRLIVFTLVGPGDIVAALYSSVQPHTHASIDLKFDDDTQGSMTLSHVEIVASALRAHVTRRDAPSFDDLHLRHNIINYNCENIDFTLWSFKADGDASVGLSCSYPIDDVHERSVGKDIFRRLTGALRKADIRKLSLSINNAPESVVPDLMQDIFCDAVSVEDLFILGDAIRYLGLLKATYVREGINAQFFPQLNRIYLKHCDLFSVDLQDIILHRRLLGNETLKTLTVRDCIVAESHVASLRTLLDVEH